MVVVFFLRVILSHVTYFQNYCSLSVMQTKIAIQGPGQIQQEYTSYLKRYGLFSLFFPAEGKAEKAP